MENALNRPLLAGDDGSQASFGTAERALTVDQIIDGYVGGFGKAQIIHVVLVTFAWTVDAFHTLVAVFSDARPAWRCLSLQNSCSTSSLCDLDRSLWEWTDGPSASIVSEWNLFCKDSFKAGIPASLFFIGCIVGAGILGRLADSLWGRKRTLIISCIIVSVSGFLTAISPNVWAYSVTRFLSGFGRAGVGICSLVLSTETVGTTLRGQAGICGFIFFTFGFTSLPAIAYLTRHSWRQTYAIISLISTFYTCVFLPFVWESPRWLALHRRETEALKVLRTMANWNRRSLPENVTVAVMAENPAGNGNGLWRSKWARKRLAVVMAAAAGSGMVYYGMPLNVGNLNFNVYVSTLLNALMEIPAILIGTCLLPRVGRKPLLAVFSCVCAAFCAVSAAAASTVDGGWRTVVGLTVLVSEIAAFLGACVTFDVWYIFCMELFSTDVRNAAVAAMRQAIMAGAAMGPYVAVMGRGRQWASFALFSALSAWTAVLTVFLPETLNKGTCETLQELRLRELEESLRKGTAADTVILA